MVEIYSDLEFVPFVPEYREDWPTLLTDACQGRIRTGAVLRVRTRMAMDLSRGIEAAAATLRPELVRAYLTEDGWWEVRETEGALVFTTEVQRDGGEPTPYAVMLPTSMEVKGYPVAIMELAKGVARVVHGVWDRLPRENAEVLSRELDRTLDEGSPEAIVAVVDALVPDEEDDDEWRLSEWMVEHVVLDIYEFDEDRPFNEPEFYLVGDVNTMLGVCDDCTGFEHGDVEAIAYLPGFEDDGRAS